MTEPGLGAIVLAAGASSRMGSPKALLRWRSSTFLEHAVALARNAGCTPVVVVDGAHPIAAAALPSGATLVTNARWQNGQLSSLQIGAKVLLSAPIHAGALVLSVDRPHVGAHTVSQLVAAHRADPTRVWQPKYQGRRGHPIVFPAPILRELLQLAPTQSARDLLTRSDIASLRSVVEVDDPAVLDNLDTPADVARIAPDDE